MSNTSCQDITNNLKYVNKSKLKLVKDKVNYSLNSNDNPPLKIDQITVDDRKINIVQEGYLLTGTKQRVGNLFINHIKKATKINLCHLIFFIVINLID
jgi:hypothetical protein